MACNTGTCTPRDLSSSGVIDANRFVQLGAPLAIRLNPNQPNNLKMCTLSFLAVEKSTNTLVIVTVGDLLSPNPTITKDRTDPQNTVNPTYYYNNKQYPYSQIYSSPTLSSFISQMAICNPLYTKAISGPITYNQVNAGISGPKAFWLGDSSASVYCDSTNQNNDRVGWQNSYVVSDPVLYSSVKLTEPMTFATTIELDAITTSTQIMIIGYQQIKMGDCGVQINSVNDTYTFTFENATGEFAFDHLLSFTRIDPACGNPVVIEDKGATIAANIGGKWKIIGIVIGFNENTGYGSRIDYIADQLNIEAWDGSLKSFNNLYAYNGPERLSGMKFITKPGLDNPPSFTQNGILYRQIGTSDLTLS
jgi:hypothetical protein